jgi:selenocysteine lyase/cysteine desulfurase
LGDVRVLQAAAATVYGIDDSTCLAERVPTLCSNLPNVAPSLVTETMSDRGIGIRDGHMYTPRLMKHLGISLDSGVIRSSLLYYNTVEEIHEFGNVLGDILRSQ